MFAGGYFTPLKRLEYLSRPFACLFKRDKHKRWHNLVMLLQTCTARQQTLIASAGCLDLINGITARMRLLQVS
jgi:hypothetical protein